MSRASSQRGSNRSCSHLDKVYVDGDITANGIESAFSPRYIMKLIESPVLEYQKLTAA